MRILLFTDTFPHLTETFVIAHARGLDADVVSLYGDEHTRRALGFSDESRYAVLAPEGVAAMRRQRRRRRVRQWWTKDGVLPWPRTLERRFERALAALQPDIVLAEFGYNAMYCRPTLKRRGIPLVTHFHGSDASKSLGRPKYRKALPGLLRDSKGIVVVSHDMSERLQTFGCPQSKIDIIPCGADLSGFAAPNRDARGATTCHFVSVARFINVKGPLSTIEAFAICRETTDCRMTMIGEGPLLANAKTLACQLGVADYIEFRGEASHQDVKQTLADADVFVQHSRGTTQNQIEGWGVAIAEASAAAMPSVATRHGGIPDQVIDGKTGFLVPEGDIHTMAARMHELALDAHKRAAMGLEARKLIESVGDQRLQTQKLAHVLERHAASAAEYCT